MYFSTHQGKWSTRVYDQCLEWVRNGCEVHVITAKYYKSDLINYKAGSYFIDGINLYIIDVEINNKHSLIRRILSFLKFSMSAILIDYKIGSAKRIYSSGPISILFQALIIKLILRKEINLEIRDLWPEGVEELGIIKNKILLNFLKSFVRKVYLNSNAIFVLSSGMKTYLSKNYNISENIIHVTPNFISKESGSASHNLDLPDKMLLYFGNFGEVNRLYDLVELFFRNYKNFDANLVLIGDGQLFNKLNEFAEKCDRIFIYPPISKDCMPIIIKQALASFVPLQEGEILDTSSPNKFFESIGQGTPVIQSTKGWIKKIVEENELGFTFDFNDDKSFVQVINLIEQNTLNRDKIKSFAFKHFDKSKIAKEILEKI